MSRLSVGIVDYGIGNHSSVTDCLLRLKYKVKLTARPHELDGVDILLLPGVGAFSLAMQNLKRRGFAEYLKEAHDKGRPLVGVCLGMQLLASSSEEGSLSEGLGIIPGAIIAFKQNECHIGWNGLKARDRLLAGLEEDYYFNHSYYFSGPLEHVIGLSTYQNITFASMIRNRTAIGMQFHPEKSQIAGGNILTSVFKELCGA